MKKKNNTYRFLNILKKKEIDNFTQEEMEKYLLDNNIYSYYEDLTLPYFTSRDENGQNLLNDFFSITYVNNVVIDEMVDWFENTGSDFNGEFEGITDRIKGILNRALDDDDKKRIIRNEYEKYSNNLNEDPFMVDEYFLKDTQNGSLSDCICSCTFEINAVLDYITEGFPGLRSRTPFMECDHIRFSFEILKFLKKEMNKITGSFVENIDNSKPIKNFNNQIFRTKEAQQWFHTTLKEMGAINEENRPQRGIFQTRCQAIFSISECKKHIFKYKLLLRNYIKFLNDSYSAKITNYSKLSDGYDYKSDVKYYLRNYLKTLN